jgi:hypothetical protein
VSFSTIVFAIWLADTPLASAVLRQESRTSRIAPWWSLDSALNQLWFPADGFTLSRISFAKFGSILLFLQVNPTVEVGDAAALDVLVIIVIREDEALRWWRCFAHDSSVAQ